jgi:mono/diheme cytochrome c family protein
MTLIWRAAIAVGTGVTIMRLVSAATFIYVLATAFVLSGSAEMLTQQGNANDEAKRREGQEIFRNDTFGDEQLWTDVLRMHEVLPSVDPATALAVGLKVDVEALPQSVIDALRAGQVDLKNPAVTIALLRLNAVVGVKGTVDEAGRLTKVGITCALCHSSVDDSFAPSIGRRMDGWANTDLNVGAIVALSPALDEATKAEFRAWGPGKYDPRHHFFDGTKIVGLNSPSLPIVIPPVYDLRGVGFETFTGDGPISYWNGYVGIGQMGGQGNFSDPRIGMSIEQSPDLITSKLPALLAYQLSLRAPKAPQGSFNADAAERGKDVFRNQARCASCHTGPTMTDVVRNVFGRRGEEAVPFLHDPASVGQDPAYAVRSATGKYRTTPLRGLQQHPPYFHDGSAPTLAAVVDHYERLFRLNLTPGQRADLIEYLKSL